MAKIPNAVMQAARVAAEARGISTEDWIAEAVNEQTILDEAHRLRAEKKPGPWPGWSALIMSDGKYINYVSSDGDEISKLDHGLDNRFRSTDARRPWIARHRDGALTNKRGACRSFSSAEAAKHALDIYHKR